MTHPDSAKVTSGQRAEAASWFARMHSDQLTSEDEAKFAAWLEADARHGEAYQEAVEIWQAVGALEARPAAGLGKQNRRRLLVTGAGAAALSAAAATGVAFIIGPKFYRTGFGEQRRVVLEDGSTLTLNTETSIWVEFSKAERRIRLEKGQAHFSVARNPERPFRVLVRDDEVRALGTRFEVRREGEDISVTLEEGSVAIIRGHGAQQRLEQAAPALIALEPGQQALFDAANAVAVVPVDTRRALAWRFGQMILDADPLSSAVAELNRYNARKIVIDSPALNDMPISGLFQTGSPDAFLDAVTAVLPAEIVSRDEQQIHVALSPQR